MRASSILLGVALGAGYAVAQSLPGCAETCVSHSKTKCNPTDYACACTDQKYIAKLQSCFETSCNEKSKDNANSFLSSLCAAVGEPIDNTAASEQMRLEMRANIEVRQADASFAATATASGRSSSSSGGFTGGGSSRNSRKGGLSRGGKVGLGIGVPLALFVVGGLAGLILWLRKQKKDKAVQQQFQPGEPGVGPQIAQYPGTGHPPPGTLAELSQGAQYIGHEMPTKHANTAEMPASPVPKPIPAGMSTGVSTGVSAYPTSQAQPPYAWPGQPEDQQPPQYYPQYGQPVVEAPATQVRAEAPGSQVQYPAPGQEWPQQQQQQAPVELPERMRSPT